MLVNAFVKSRRKIREILRSVLPPGAFKLVIFFYNVLATIFTIARNEYATVLKAKKARYIDNGVLPGAARNLWIYTTSLVFAIPGIVYETGKGAYLVVWAFSLKRRKLINRQSAGISGLLQRGAFQFLFWIADIRYRYAFDYFDRNSEIHTRGDIKASGKGIMHIIGTLGTGGSERQLYLTVKGLIGRRVEQLRVYCLSINSKTERFYKGDLEAISVPVRSFSDLNVDNQLDRSFINMVNILPSSLRNEVMGYTRVLSKDPPEVLHLWLDDINVKGGLAAVICRVPKIILGLRSFPPYYFGFHQPYMRETYRWLAKQANVMLLCNSQGGAREYEQWLELESDSIEVIHNGFDFEKNKSVPDNKNFSNELKIFLAAQPAIIGSVFRFTEEKQPLIWVQIAAASININPGLRFLLVGDGPMKEETMQYAVKLGIGNYIHFTGNVRDVASYLALMDLFLLTSRIEGLPNVLVEAQAQEVPVVAFDSGGASETFIHKQTGWLLEDEDILSAANRINSLLGDTNWKLNAGQDARRYVLDTFSLDKMIDKTMSLYSFN